MKAQFKYSFLEHSAKRGIAVAIVLAMNLVFGLLGYYNIYGEGWKITAVTLCSIALCGIFILCIITDFEMLRGICTAPAGYATILTPVESWKIILPRVVTILVEDIILFCVGIAGVVMQSFILARVPFETLYRDTTDGPSLWMVITFILGYIYLILIVLFCIVLAKSFFYSVKAGTLLAILATAAVVYAFNLLNFILAPLGVVENVNIFYNVQLVMGANAGMFAYILLELCKSAALFLTCSYLMERKINI